MSVTMDREVHVRKLTELLRPQMKKTPVAAIFRILDNYLIYLKKLETNIRQQI